MQRTPLLDDKTYAAPSVFAPENLLREARRQKNLPSGPVPEVCVLDPDGDIVRAFPETRRNPHWACYHTVMHDIAHAGEAFGVVGCAVGASFAVLVAEQLFASGCKFLVSVTSSGQIASSGPTPYFILIDRALRDEGTSLHYLPPSRFALAEAGLIERIGAGLADRQPPVRRGATWTTDAPFRETAAAIEAARQQGALAVEMEAAALYAFASARRHPVVCFAHVTNQMAQVEGDFEKGAANGAYAALDLIAATVRAWRAAE
jgi:uridine phosphorylase